MIYLIAVNLFSFFLCYLDKWKAIHHQWRISEKMLLFFSMIGGCFGMLIGMYYFHHKIRKLKFKFIYLFCVVWVLLLYFVYIY